MSFKQNLKLHQERAIHEDLYIKARKLFSRWVMEVGDKGNWMVIWCVLLLFLVWMTTSLALCCCLHNFLLVFFSFFSMIRGSILIGFLMYSLAPCQSMSMPLLPENLSAARCGFWLIALVGLICLWMCTISIKQILSASLQFYQMSRERHLLFISWVIFIWKCDRVTSDSGVTGDHGIPILS